MNQPWWKNNRGEWYVIAQFFLFALVGLGPVRLPGIPNWPASWSLISLVIGLGLGLAGFLLSIAGLLRLGPNLTPLPHPKDDATLVETGVYGLVRHPIYSGIILAAFGWAGIRASTLTLLYVALLFIFFDFKTRREERWLAAKFTAYTAYQGRVRKLIPWIY